MGEIGEGRGGNDEKNENLPDFEATDPADDADLLITEGS
jgi:hypothetical protein